MLLPHFAKDPDFDKRFRREARIAARLDDPHVVPIYDVGEYEGQPYFSMGLIESGSLAHAIGVSSQESGRASRRERAVVGQESEASISEEPNPQAILTLTPDP